MAYSKTTWVDRLVQFANRYTKSGETSTSVTLAADPGTVTQAGTPLNAGNLNKLETQYQEVKSELAKTGGGSDIQVHGSNLLAGSVTAAKVAPDVAKQAELDAVGALAVAALPASSYTAADVLAKIKTVDGPGSGLDADTVDGVNVGNGTGQIPLNNGTVNSNLNADRVDGIHLRINGSVPEYSTDGSTWLPMGGIKSVQRGVTNVPIMTALANVTISAVNMGKSFVTMSFTSNDNAGTQYYRPKIRLTTSTNLEITRGTTVNSLVDVAWEVVEFY